MALLNFFSSLFGSTDTEPAEPYTNLAFRPHPDSPSFDSFQAPRSPRTPDSIEPINRWRHGDRILKRPRRLDDTPTKEHYDHDLRRGRSAVRGRKRCPSCGTILRKETRDAGGEGFEVGDLEEARKIVERVKSGRVAKGRPAKTKATKLKKVVRGKKPSSNDKMGKASFHLAKAKAATSRR